MSINRYVPILKIAGEEAPLRSFTFNAPANALGVRVDAEIADVEVEFGQGDTCDLILKNRGGAEPRARLIKNGRVIASDRGIGAARALGLTVRADSLSVSATDRIADKWKLAPRRPVILYDPAYITLQDNETNTNINGEDGNRIYAATRSIGALDLIQILRFAYIEKCGFSDVVTNLPNYRIPRADFSLNAAFHAIAASFYGFFKPLVFEDDGRIFIIDVFGNIPAGMLSGARKVRAKHYLAYNKSEPETDLVNAVLLTHKEISVQSIGDELPVGVTQRVEEDPPSDIGNYGEVGWQRTILRRYVAEIHDDIDNPDVITSEIVWRTETRTTGRDENGVIRELEINTQTEFYSNSWRLKIGWRREATIYAGNGNGTKLLQQAETETGFIYWRPSIRNPGEYEKVRMLSQLEGLVVVEGEDDDPDQTKTPLRDAERAGAIPDDGSAEITRLPISTTTQIWRDTGADQIQVLVTKIDQLKNKPESSGTTEHVGTNAVRVRNGDAINTKTVLLVDEDSDAANGARQPIAFDAGYVPYATAKELAYRELASVNAPPPRVRVSLAEFDAGIRRGSIRRVFDRDGNSVKVIVTGYSLSGTATERGQLVISQVIDGVALG